MKIEKQTHMIVYENHDSTNSANYFKLDRFLSYKAESHLHRRIPRIYELEAYGVGAKIYNENRRRCG